MKILFDYKIFYQQKYGGISSYFYNLGKEFIKKNQEVLFSTPIHKNEYLKDFPKEIIFGINIKYIPHSLNFFTENINHFFSNRHINSIHPEVVHESYYSYKSYENRKIVCTVYDMINEKYPIFFNNTKEISNLKKKTLERADHIICISNNTKKDLLEYFNIDEKKISVTLLASNFKEICNNNKNLKNKLLFIGSRYGYKNFNKFIEAYSSSDFLKKNFQIIAYGGEKYNHEDKKILEKFKLNTNHVSFFNDKNHELKYLYSNVAAFIYPSIYEGFGIPILEAMKCGCPVILSNGGSIKEIGGPGLEYFDPFCSENIKENMENVLLSDEKQRQIIEYGYKRSKNYSWHKCANETLEAYKKVL